jgi:tRNA-specific 2-thiouridylase
MSDGLPGPHAADDGAPLVLAALSGGVDSAVAAACIREAGFRVMGVTMKLWDYAEVGGTLEARDGRCCSLEDIAGARNSAARLDIPYYVMDMTEPFRRTVIDDFIREYRSGRTPNPCVVCNNRIKWTALYARARQVGATGLVTGHYARVRYDAATERRQLLRGVDATRDQSYVLWGLTQEQLASSLLPLGEWTKRDVRERARALGLPVADKPESREICFVTDDNYRRFLRDKLPDDPATQPGPIVDHGGRRIGTHNGFADYTIGQRRGIGVAARAPYYVRRIDVDTQTVHVAPDGLLWSDRCEVERVNWVSIVPPAGPLPARVQIRSQHAGADATLQPEATDRVTVLFREPQRALTPGQSAVFYDGDLVLGGGVVASPANPGG